MQNFLSILNEFLYSNILILLLVVTGLYFSIKTKFVQFRLFPEGIRLLKEKSKHENSVSSFQALMISTASRVGTGNIAGVATALAAGGPGSIFWMWLTAFIGGASAFIESTLAQVYKEKDGEAFRGGPAYYIEKALTENDNFSVQISVDSGTAETYCKVKGQNGFSIVWNTIRNYCRSGKRVFVKYIMFSYNSSHKEIDAFINSAIARECLISVFRLNLLQIGRGKRKCHGNMVKQS